MRVNKYLASISLFVALFAITVLVYILLLYSKSYSPATSDDESENEYLREITWISNHGSLRDKTWDIIVDTDFELSYSGITLFYYCLDLAPQNSIDIMKGKLTGHIGDRGYESIYKDLFIIRFLPLEPFADALDKIAKYDNPIVQLGLNMLYLYRKNEIHRIGEILRIWREASIYPIKIRAMRELDELSNDLGYRNIIAPKMSEYNQYDYDMNGLELYYEEELYVYYKQWYDDNSKYLFPTPKQPGWGKKGEKAFIMK